jgi:hypothetical protein
MERETRRQQLEKILADRSEVFRLEDGFFYYEQIRPGAIGSGELRLIADILDDKNREWSAEVEKGLRESNHKHARQHHRQECQCEDCLYTPNNNL